MSAFSRKGLFPWQLSVAHRCTLSKSLKGFVLFVFSSFFFGIHLKHEDKILSSLLSLLVSQNSMLNLSLQQRAVLLR